MSALEARFTRAHAAEAALGELKSKNTILETEVRSPVVRAGLPKGGGQPRPCAWSTRARWAQAARGPLVAGILLYGGSTQCVPGVWGE